MDKSILIQYSNLVEESKDLRRLIQKNQDDIDKLEVVSDSVKGTRRDGTIGNILITGFPSPRYYKLKGILYKRQRMLTEKEDELLELINQVDDYINSIEDSELRIMFRLYYVDDLNWLQVSNRMNKMFKKRKYTEDSCRCKHNRFLEKLKNDGNDG